MAELDPRVLKMFKDFMSQDEHLEAFLTGPAGSGKTTELRAGVDWLEEQKINYLVVAYTHQAAKILRSKLPENAVVKTLHSWLKKRPGINEKATHIKALSTNHQMGRPDHLQLLIVDEFSFVGELDYLSIGELQDELALETWKCAKCGEEFDDKLEACLKCEHTEMKDVSPEPIKVLYSGDLNQLSPIKGESAVIPIEPFWTKLTTIHRQTTTISGPLSKLVSIIEGEAPMAYLEPTDNFQRGVDIDTLYKADKEDKIMLAFTNKAVQAHNRAIQGYSFPESGDEINIMTTKEHKHLAFVYDTFKDCIGYDELTTVGGTLTYDSKFKPLQFLDSLEYVKYFVFDDGTVMAGIFGSYENKKVRERLGKALVKSNKANLTKEAKQKYREYKTVNDFVNVMDFNHCMTIHKSQGSEFTNVYVDSKDLGACINIDEKLKLLYVAMSRSKHSIFMNN